MTPFVLHISESGETEPSPPWRDAVVAAGIEIQRVPGAAPAVALLRNHTPLAVLLCMKEGAARSLEVLRELRASNLPLPPVIGICTGLPDSEAQTRLVAEGMGLFLHAFSPPAILVGQLALHRSVGRRNGSAAAGDGEAAGGGGPVDREVSIRARKLIHDLSQPLAAIQGRLEILGIKASADDPMKPVYTRLVGMCAQAAETVQSLREIHRRP